MAYNYVSDDYIPIEDAYNPNNVIYRQTRDEWPRHDYWRNNPLSERSWIRPNVAGYLPMKRQMVTVPKSVEANPPQTWQYAWYYPGGMIWPANPQWQKERTIILER